MRFPLTFSGWFICLFNLCLCSANVVVAEISLTLAWDPSPDHNRDVVEYRLHYTETSSSGQVAKRKPNGKKTTGSIEGIKPGSTYTIYVTAVNSAGLESEPSNFITFTAPAAVNQPPVMAAISDQILNSPRQINLRLMATDAETPSGDLVFSLVSGPPGATVTPGGIFSWKAERGASHLVTVKVTDNGSPPLSDTSSFRVMVATANSKAKSIPDGSTLSWVAETSPEKRLLFTSDLGLGDADYVHYLQASEDLRTWTTIKVITDREGPPDLIQDAAAEGARMRFYRIISRQLPPRF
jgi:hypothetical protein